MRKIAFLPTAFEDFNRWAAEDKRIYARIVKLIRDIDRSPFLGLGKPEPFEYGGKFVALQDGKVVSAGDTFEELLKNMKVAGIDDEEVVFQYVEPEGVAVVY